MSWLLNVTYKKISNREGRSGRGGGKCLRSVQPEEFEVELEKLNPSNNLKDNQEDEHNTFTEVRHITTLGSSGTNSKKKVPTVNKWRTTGHLHLVITKDSINSFFQIKIGTIR